MCVVRSDGTRGRLLGSVIPGKSLPLSGLSFSPTKWEWRGKGHGTQIPQASPGSDLLCVRIKIGRGGGRSFWGSFQDLGEEKRMDGSYSRTKDWVAHRDLF